MPRNWADDECFRHMGIFDASNRIDYDNAFLDTHALADKKSFDITRLSSLSEKTTREGSLVDDPVLDDVIVELESQKIKSIVDKNKTLKLRKMLAEAREELSQSQIEVMRLNAEAIVHDEVVVRLKVDASATSKIYEANLTKFRNTVTRFQQDISKYKTDHETIAAVEKQSYDAEIIELKKKNKEFERRISLHKKEKEILSNIITKMKTSIDVCSKYSVNEKSVHANGLRNINSAVDGPSKCARKPIVSLRFSRNRSPRAASISPHNINITPSSPSTQLPFMSPKKLAPYRSYGAKL